MVRFVHTADWQLGMTRHFLGPDAQPRFSAARIEAVRAVGALAEAEGAAFVVVAGDVFETNHVERQVVVRALEAMAATPGVTFYLLPGNHDPLDAASVFRSRAFTTHRPANVVVLEDHGPVEVAPGVELVAAPWANKHPVEDLAAAALATLPAGTATRILVAHGAVDALGPDRTTPATILTGRLEAELEAGHLAYVALGDRHSTTSVGRTGRIWYSGAAEATDFRETDPGHALVVELDGPEITVTPHRVGTWRFVAHEAALTGPAEVGELHSFLDELEDTARTIVRLRLVGQLSLADKATLDDVLAHHADLLASLETWAPGTELVVVPESGDFSGLQLAGFAGAALDDLQAVAAGGQADVARDALALLYRLAGGAA
jgi:DNA repair exonuclease SbcCD nuclease subunit